MIQAYKAFTHDLRSPLQGGEPVWDGKLPFTLPPVKVDTSSKECGAGWNACFEGHTTLRIAGLWPEGWPIRLFRVQTSARVVVRGDKVRAASWELIAEENVNPHILAMSAYFGDMQQEMADQQILWHIALGRGRRDEKLVLEGLSLSLQTKGLQWNVVKYKNARGAWGAWDAWDAWGAWDARGAWGAWGAWDARGAWGAWGAWDARGALCVYYISKRKYATIPALKLTAGIRDAYQNGLLLALPTGNNELGYVMCE